MVPHWNGPGTLGLLLVLVLFAVCPLFADAAKILNHNLEGAPESLDFAKASSIRAERVGWLLCDQLVYVAKDGKTLEPGLVERFTVSANGREVSMKLRPSARFHDGSSIDSQAVKASVERQFQPTHPLYTKDPKNTKEAMLSDLIDEILTPDPRSLLLKLKYPGLHYLTEVDIGSPNALARLGKDFGRNPVCSGPFKFMSWSNDRIVLAAYENYWAGRPKLDQVILHIVPESTVMLDKLLRGDLDFAPVITEPTQLEKLREHPGMKLIAVPAINIFYLGMATERPPFNNPLLRKAMSAGIDWPRISQFLGRGTADTAKGPLSPSMKSYDPDVSQATYNPQAAQELLKRADYKGDQKIRLIYVNTVAFITEQVHAMQSDLRRIGVNIELIGKPNFGDLVQAVRAREGEMFYYAYHVRAPYPERILTPLFHSRSIGSTNLTHYQNPLVDSLLDEGLRLPEGDEQRRLYARVQRLIVEDAPMVFLFHWKRVAAHSDRVKGLELKLDSAPVDKLVGVDLLP